MVDGSRHILIDCFESGLLHDLEHVEDVCYRAVKATGATVIGESFHYSGKDISGVILLAGSSHLSIQTKQDGKFAMIDLFVDHAVNALPVIANGFRVGRMVLKRHRDTLDPKKT